MDISLSSRRFLPSNYELYELVYHLNPTLSSVSAMPRSPQLHLSRQRKAFTLCSSRSLHLRSVEESLQSFCQQRRRPRIGWLEFVRLPSMPTSRLKFQMALYKSNSKSNVNGPWSFLKKIKIGWTQNLVNYWDYNEIWKIKVTLNKKEERRSRFNFPSPSSSS